MKKPKFTMAESLIKKGYCLECFSKKRPCKCPRPILDSNDFFLIKRAVEIQQHNLENRDWWIVVSHMDKDHKGHAVLDVIRKEMADWDKALTNLCKLFESQYPQPIKTAKDSVLD